MLLQVVLMFSDYKKRCASFPHRLPDVWWLVCHWWTIGHHDDNRHRDWGCISPRRPGPAPLAHWPRPDGPITAPDHRLSALHAAPRADAQARLHASRRPRQHGDGRRRSHSQSSRWRAVSVAAGWRAEAVFCGRNRARPAVSRVAEEVMIFYML